MKHVITLSSFVLFATLLGCNEGTSGGPGATNPPSEAGFVIQADNTFSLETPMLSTKLRQGESAVVPIRVGSYRVESTADATEIIKASLPVNA